MPSNTHPSHEIQSIDDQVQKLEREHSEATRRFLDRRAALMRRLNDLQPFTRNLPPEIMSLILYYSILGVSAPTQKTIALGHVSHHWHQIVWSTPRLWAQAFLSITTRNAHRIPHLILLHLNNSGGLPLALHLNIPYYEYEVESLDAEAWDPVIKFFSCKENTSKVQTLSLDKIPQIFSPFLTQDLLLHLENLTILGSFPLDEAKISPTNLPCLSSLVIHCVNHHGRGMTIENVELVWSKMTTLKLTHMSIDFCAKFLLLCPNLKRLSIASPRDSGPNSMWFNKLESTDVIPLHQLETLTLTYERWISRLYRPLQMPSIQTIIFADQWHFKPFVDVPPILTSIVFRFCYHDSVQFFAKLFHQVPQLRELTFYHSRSIVQIALRADEGEQEMLRSLNKLVIIDYKIREDVVEPIVNFLERKWRNGCPSFRLEIRDTNIEWTLSAKNRLSSMQEAGFRLEIEVT